MPSVVFWAGVGGGTREYRCRVPGEALRRAGWDVRYADNGDDLDADVVVLQRVAEPGTADLMRSLRATVVYDIDDWYDGVPAYNPAAEPVAGMLDEAHAAMAAADLITCSTPELAEGYGRFGPTVVLPNYLDPELWSDAELARYRPEHDKVHVGWAGNAAYRSADLDLLRPWLASWLQRNPDVRFVAAGGPDILEYLEVPGLASPATEFGNHFRPYDHLPALLTWLDVGLVPLVYNRFNEAKSWCKGLEYGAAGAAVVASPSREYRSYVRPGVNGHLVRRHDWCGALDRTLDCLDEVRAGARMVADEFMIDRHVGRWVEAYSSVLVGAA